MGMRQTDERISQKADRLHLTFLRDHLPEVLESIMAANMTTREAFDFAFGKEIEQREINRFKQALQAAHFPCIKRLFDFSAQPSIDPGTIQELAKPGKGGSRRCTGSQAQRDQQVPTADH